MAPDTTQRDPAELPQPQTGALAPPDFMADQEGVDSLAQPPDMGSTIAKAQIAAGQTNHGTARDWAENAVAGVQAALAGFGAAGDVPAGAGALYGVGKAAAASQANRQQQQQQKIQNQRAQQQQDREDRQESREEQLSNAQIAHLNAEQHNIERLGRNADRESMQKMVDFDAAAAQPYIEAGTPSLGEHLTSDDLQRMLKPGANGKSEINGHEVLPFKDGLTDVIGKDGRPVLDPEGNPMQRPTYRLFAADGPQVKLTDAQAKLISDNTDYHPQAGRELSPVDAFTLQTLAKKNLAVNANIEKIQAETGHFKAETQTAEEAAQEKQIKQQAAKLFSPYLAQANGDPWKAVQLMSRDPNGRGQLGIVEQAYGPGEIEKWHNDQQERAIQQAELEEKKLSGPNAVWGDPQAATPQAFRASLTPQQLAAVDMVGKGQAPLHNPGYIIARNPGFIQAVATLYPGTDLSKIDAYQDAYKDFVKGKVGTAVNSGATALEHLNELKALNTGESMIPGTPAHTRYENKVGTVVSELMDFYRMAKTDTSEKAIKDTLDSATTWNRNAAILTQAQSMGDKLDNYKDQWDHAAPSAVYEAQYPAISDTAKARNARASLDPAYGVKIGYPTAKNQSGQQVVLIGGKWIPVPPAQ